jgi:hypothetical protein
MKLRVDNPKPPISLIARKQDGTEFPTKAWACGECGSIFSSDSSAAICCKQNYCECGTKLETYQSRCSTCCDIDRFNRAEIIEWDGESYLYDENTDHYYADFDELFDYEEDDPPEFLYACKPHKWRGVDFEDCVQQSLEDHYEDAIDHIKGLAEMALTVKEWCKKQDIVSWSPDYGRKVRVPMRNETESGVGLP